MTTVLDASAGIEVVLNRSRAVEIVKVLEVSNKVFSPELYKAEVTNALWKYLKAGQINKDKAISALVLAMSLVDVYADPAEYSSEVLLESLRLNHSSYDMFYLVLTRRSGSTLLSLDKKLNAAAAREGLDILTV
ncbi:MAG: hypothetical protein DRP70_13110 [Spirochaetes bacterium]|nr:MAG: hypothetical protein DRP70_13110 [Spirochaetota bacterium]